MTGTAGEAGDSPPPAPGYLRTKVLRGGAYLFIRQFLSLGLSLVGVFVITRVIGPERYGAFVAASGIYIYLQTLGQVGVDVYLVRQPGSVAERDSTMSPRLSSWRPDYWESCLSRPVPACCPVGLRLPGSSHYCA